MVTHRSRVECARAATEPNVSGGAHRCRRQVVAFGGPCAGWSSRSMPSRLLKPFDDVSKCRFILPTGACRREGRGTFDGSGVPSDGPCRLLHRHNQDCLGGHELSGRARAACDSYPRRVGSQGIPRLIAVHAPAPRELTCSVLYACDVSERPHPRFLDIGGVCIFVSATMGATRIPRRYVAERPACLRRGCRHIDRAQKLSLSSLWRARHTGDGGGQDTRALRWKPGDPMCAKRAGLFMQTLTMCASVRRH